MPAFEKKLEVIANLAIIIAAGFLGYSVLRGQFTQAPSQTAAKSAPVVGSSIQAGDIKLAQRNLIFALSTTCHFCSESMLFYSRLSQTGDAHKTTQFVAVFPEGVEAGKKYLKDKRVQVDQVADVPFNMMGVVGTPTLILTDGTGKVLNRWVGKLTSLQESEVVASLSSTNPNFSQ